jgi:hypothetical protein
MVTAADEQQQQQDNDTEARANKQTVSECLQKILTLMGGNRDTRSCVLEALVDQISTVCNDTDESYKCTIAAPDVTFRWPETTPPEPRLVFMDSVGDMNNETSRDVMAKYVITLETFIGNAGGFHLHGLTKMCNPSMTGIARMQKISRNLQFMKSMSPENWEGTACGGGIDMCARLDRTIKEWNDMMVTSFGFHQFIDAKNAGNDVPPLLPMVRITTVAEREELKANQQLLEFYLTQACQQGVRRHEEEVFEPLRLSDGTFTRHYKRKCTVTEWLYDVVHPKENHINHYDTLTSSSGVRTYLADQLKFIKSNQFPFLQKSRSHFSYRNGVLDVNERVFYLYNYRLSSHAKSPHIRPISDLPSDVCTAKFHDAMLPLAYVDHNMDPMTIPTPHMDSIFRTQKFDDYTLKVFYALCGRLLHDVGKHDDFQSALYIRGVAGSGKSTFFQILGEAYEYEDLGFLNDDSEEVFGVQHLSESYVVFCLDVSDAFKLSSTRFNSFASGETVTIARKFKTVLTKKWQAPMAFASNTLPPIDSKAGSGARRFTIFDFVVAISDVDQKLGEKCRAELPVFIQKITHLYFWLIDHVKAADGNFWNIAPSMVTAARDEYMAATSPIAGFLLSDFVVLEPGLRSNFAAIRAQFNLYLQRFTETSSTGKRGHSVKSASKLSPVTMSYFLMTSKVILCYLGFGPKNDKGYSPELRGNTTKYSDARIYENIGMTFINQDGETVPDVPVASSYAHLPQEVQNIYIEKARQAEEARLNAIDAANIGATDAAPPRARELPSAPVTGAHTRKTTTGVSKKRDRDDRDGDKGNTSSTVVSDEHAEKKRKSIDSVVVVVDDHDGSNNKRKHGIDEGDADVVSKKQKS